MRHYGSERSTRLSSSSGDPSSGVGYALSDHEACSHLVESLGEKNWKGKGRDNAGMRIPMDILFLIFVECDVKSLVTCRLICRQFDTFIKNQKGLLYKLALAFERQIDSPCQIFQPYVNVASTSTTFMTDTLAPSNSPPLSSHQKLQRLRRQGLAWRGDLPPALKVSLPVTRNDSIYELNGGVFALGDVHGTDAGSQWGPMSTLQEGTRLDFVRLPSVIKGDFTPEWGCINVGKGVSIVDFTMDVDMDLLVLIEHVLAPPAPLDRTPRYRLHILSLSRSVVALESHPLAYAPLLEYPCHPDWSDYQLVFGMYGDHIGLLLGSCQESSLNYDRIVIWDWKKGSMAALHANREVFDTFLFLDEGLLLIPNVMTSTLDLVSYKLSDPSSDLESPTNGSFTTLMAFKLPALRSGLAYMYILARGQPTGISEQKSQSNVQSISSTSQAFQTPLQSPESSEETDSPIPNPFNFEPGPFSPSIDESIIVVSTRVGNVTNGGNQDDMDNGLNDADGTLILTRRMFWDWMDKYSIKKEDGVYQVPSEGAADSITDDHGPSLSRDYDTTIHDSEPVQHSPIHRSTGVQTVPEMSLKPVESSRNSSSIKVVAWRKWMRETRWLQEMGSPRWVRDVYGMRVATRIREQPNASPYPIPQSMPVPLPGIHQLFASAPAPVIALIPAVPPPGQAFLGNMLPVLGHAMPLPSITALFAPANPTIVSYLTPIAPLPPLTPMPYRTRIFDFNVLPHKREPGTVPYPSAMKLDLMVEKENLRLDGTSGGQEIERTYYGDDAMDQGWSTNNDGLEWRRRPVWEETVIKPGITYAEEIRTGLPYLEITSRHFNDCAALMMDAERIIGMKTDDVGNLISLEVLVM